MDYYKLLGVEHNADAVTIKAAFRKLAKKYHPDTNQGNAQAEKMFKDINEAYSVLSDETKRREYDESLQPGTHSNGMNSNSSTTKKKATGYQNPFMGGFSMKFDFDDIMGAGMNYEREDKSKKDKAQAGQPDFLKFDQQFANFFGFNPKKK